MNTIRPLEAYGFVSPLKAKKMETLTYVTYWNIMPAVIDFYA